MAVVEQLLRERGVASPEISNAMRMIAEDATGGIDATSSSGGGGRVLSVSSSVDEKSGAAGW